MNNSETQQQCNKLRAELALQKEHASAFADSAILSLRDIRILEDLNTQKEQAIESLQHSLTQALNEADELRGEVIVANASSELTNIMRMVQALEDTPQDKIDGAIYLIKRVLYDAICKLDPSQAWDA